MPENDDILRRHPIIPQDGLFDAEPFIDPTKPATVEWKPKPRLRDKPNWTKIRALGGRLCHECLRELERGERTFPRRAVLRRWPIEGEPAEFCAEHGRPLRDKDKREQ